MDKKFKFQTIGFVAGVTGFCMVGFGVSWLAASGVFVMLFANNIEQKSQVM